MSQVLKKIKSWNSSTEAWMVITEANMVKITKIL